MQLAPDQVCVPAELSIAKGVMVAFEGSDVSPPHLEVRPVAQTPAPALLPPLTSLHLRCGLTDCLLLSGPPPLPPSVAPTPPQTSRPPPRSREVVAAAPSRPTGSSPSLHHLGSSAGRWAPSSPSSSPMAALISIPPWLLPPSTPPWGTTLAVAWRKIHQPLLKATTWLTPTSSPPWTLLFVLLPVVRSPH
ncbi:hypothetical protein PO909_015862 [Leuciscus waleckii]